MHFKPISSRLFVFFWILLPLVFGSKYLPVYFGAGGGYKGEHGGKVLLTVTIHKANIFLSKNTKYEDGNSQGHEPPPSYVASYHREPKEYEPHPSYAPEYAPYSKYDEYERPPSYAPDYLPYPRYKVYKRRPSYASDLKYPGYERYPPYTPYHRSYPKYETPYYKA